MRYNHKLLAAPGMDFYTGSVYAFILHNVEQFFPELCIVLEEDDKTSAVILKLLLSPICGPKIISLPFAVTLTRSPSVC